jgi:starvation-inducible DNA-binding protein
MVLLGECFADMAVPGGRVRADVSFGDLDFGDLDVYADETRFGGKRSMLDLAPPRCRQACRAPKAHARTRPDARPADTLVARSLPMKTLDADAIIARATPQAHQQAHELQPFGHLVKMPIALSENVCQQSVENLNQLLADTISLRDLYKKHHWQVAGPTFYQLHLLFDKHANEQTELIDSLAERIQLLGGVSLAMAHDVAETTLLPRPPRGREEVPVQISRLLHAHEIILKEARTMARQAAENGDDGTNDLLVSDIIRTNELQVWFVAEHVVDAPLARA